MKILYALQGTGNGHLSRARDIIPILQKWYDLDILISGTQADIELPYPVKYKFNGLGFIFGEKGGVDFLETYKKNKLKILFSEINDLDVESYDLVINDFEPVSAWACKLKNVKCISLSHQSAVLDKSVPQPENVDYFGKAILKNYAPSDAQYGFHFKAYKENIFTPVIRAEVREQLVTNEGHYTVYLPSYDDGRILKVLRQIKTVRWDVFSKHNKMLYAEDNISIQAINNEAFIKSIASSEGVLCGAGFETPAEALFLKKKLLVIPMKGQYEQSCNAAALKEMGVPVIKSLKSENIEKIDSWIKSEIRVEVDFPDITEEIINKIIMENEPTLVYENSDEESKQYSFKKFRKMILKKIKSEQ
jgi:uncharacterized protein (TIGR00661 family)